ncbi:hypothetical protein K0M31_010767, partial [Melipona bicolor]
MEERPVSQSTAAVISISRSCTTATPLLRPFKSPGLSSAFSLGWIHSSADISKHDHFQPYTLHLELYLPPIAQQSVD